MELSFGIDLHDFDGDVYKKCVLLFINDTTILSFDTVENLEKFADDIKYMIPEIKDNLKWR